MKLSFAQQAKDDMEVIGSMRFARRSRLFGWLFAFFGRCVECGRGPNDHVHGGGCSDDRDDALCSGKRHHHFERYA